MILLDMMGYKNLRLGRADLGTTWLTDIVWQTGKQLGYGNVFIDSQEGLATTITDRFCGLASKRFDIIQLSTYGRTDQSIGTPRRHADKIRLRV